MTLPNGVTDDVLGKFSRQQHDWFERVRKGSLDPQQVARAVQKIINSGGIKPEYTKIISPLLSIPAVDGKRTIASAKDIFVYVDDDFKNWGADEPGKPTKGTKVVVREMTKNATFPEMFSELSPDLMSLCLTQDQILYFVANYEKWLRTDGCGTFFLFKSYGQFFVAYVRFNSDGGLGVYIDRPKYDLVWSADYRHHVVVPRLT